MLAYNCGHFVDTLPQAGARPRGKAQQSRRSGKPRSEETKNSTIEASMLMKTNDGILKRTQNELKNQLRIDCTMRAINAEFELVDATRVPASVWDAGMRPASGLPGRRRSGGACCEAESRSQAAGCRRFVTIRPSTADFSTRILTNEPGMSMKTKSREVEASNSRGVGKPNGEVKR
jgi:hypothetical protein